MNTSVSASFFYCACACERLVVCVLFLFWSGVFFESSRQYDYFYLFSFCLLYAPMQNKNKTAFKFQHSNTNFLFCWCIQFKWFIVCTFSLMQSMLAPPPLILSFENIHFFSFNLSMILNLNSVKKEYGNFENEEEEEEKSDQPIHSNEFDFDLKYAWW